MERLRNHAKAIFQNAPEAPPWAQMAICGLATTGPLVVGFLNGDLSSAIYAALLGYFVALNDHLGTLAHRLLVGTLSYLVLVTMLSLGVLLQNSFSSFVIVILVSTYCVGLMGGRGAEMERLLLFGIVELLVSFYARRISPNAMVSVFHYGWIAYALVMIGMVASNVILRGRTVAEFAALKPSLLSFFTLRRLRHLYALSFMLTVLLAIVCVRVFAIERGYWTIVTVVLIMKPDRKESVYRSFQRFVGTLLGVAFGDAVIGVVHDAEILIGGVMISAFLIPYAMKRNYWMVAFLVSIVVILVFRSPRPPLTIPAACRNFLWMFAQLDWRAYI